MTSIMQSISAPAVRLKPGALSDERTLKHRTSIVLLALIASLALPEELSFYAGELRITIARAILIVISPYVLFRFVSLTIQGSIRLAASDILVFAAGIWMMVAIGVMQGFDKAIASAGVLALEFTMTYLAARTLVRYDKDIIASLRVICISTSIVALLSPLDSISGTFFVHNWFGSLTGYHRLAQTDYRMGLLRASGTLEHPILLGAVCTVSILLSSALPKHLRWPVRFSCLIGLILSFSSAPLSGLFLGLGLLAYGRIFKNIQARWSLLFGFVLAMVIAIFIVTKNPLGFIFSNLTFDPGSAYYRLLIWQYGGDALMTSPIFGIGLETEWFREDWMSKSVDAFLLASAMNFGIPGAVLIALTWIAPAVWPPVRTKEDDECLDAHCDLRTTMNIVFIIIFFIGMTVSFWGTTWMLFSLLAGLRASLGAQTAGWTMS